MDTVRSLGPTKTASMPGIEQIASRFSTDRGDSIMGQKSVLAHFCAIYAFVFSLGHSPAVITRSSASPFNGRYFAAATKRFVCSTSSTYGTTTPSYVSHALATYSGSRLWIRTRHAIPLLRSANCIPWKSPISSALCSVFTTTKSSPSSGSTFTASGLVVYWRKMPNTVSPLASFSLTRVLLMSCFLLSCGQAQG